ncbi:MAG: glycosyl hydrolase family 28-related protein [Terriglobia bacterium]
MKGLLFLMSILSAAVVVGSAQAQPKNSSANLSKEVIRDSVVEDQVFNVKAYGAKGDGATDDTAAFDAALRAALARGGRIYFPSGTFILSNPSAITHQQTSDSVSIECSGPTSTTLLLKGNGFVMKDNWAAAYFYGYVRGCKFDLSHAPAGAAAIHLVDSDGWSIEGDSFTSSSAGHIGIEVENQNGWCERNYIVHDSFYGLTPSVLFQQDRGDRYNSFAYNILAFDHFQVPKGGDGVQIVGNAVVYSNFWVLRANMDGPGDLVHALRGAHLRYNYYDIRGEGGGAGSYMLCADSTSAISGNGTVYAFGTGNDQGFSCPGKDNITVDAQVSAASNVSWPDWLSTGKAVSVYGGAISIDGAEGTGNVIGPNISSPFVYMYFQPRNAFVIGTVNSPPNLSQFTPRQWFDSSGNGVLTGHLQVGGSTGPTWRSGSGSPQGSCTNGSLYSNTQGSRGSTLYVCVSGSWADVK